MGRKTKQKKDSVNQNRYPLRPAPNWPLLALAAIGILLTGYLSYTSFAGGSVKGCAVGGGCDLVLGSNWSKLFGLPTAFWGLLAYIALAGTAFIKRVDRHWLTAWSIALFGICFSLYLTTISFTVIKAACPYCLTSLALMSAIFGLLTWQRPVEVVSKPWPRLLSWRLPAVAILLLLFHSDFTTPPAADQGPEDPMTQLLAEHLKQTGAKFYGASWCPHCQQQKAIFGASAKRLPYIECHPGGQNTPPTVECREARITSYPTWLINGRYISEVLPLDRLAQESKFVWTGAKTQ